MASIWPLLASKGSHTFKIISGSRLATLGVTGYVKGSKHSTWQPLKLLLRGWGQNGLRLASSRGQIFGGQYWPPMGSGQWGVKEVKHFYWQALQFYFWGQSSSNLRLASNGTNVLSFVGVQIGHPWVGGLGQWLKTLDLTISSTFIKRPRPKWPPFGLNMRAIKYSEICLSANASAI